MDHREKFDREFTKLRCRKSVKDVGSDFEIVALTLYETSMYLDVIDLNMVSGRSSTY